jgi:hypothetical protein
MPQDQNSSSLYEDYTETEEDKTDTICTIEYSVSVDGEMYIDISLAGEEDDSLSLESLDKLAKLFASIPSVQFQLRSLEIMQEAFLVEDKEDEFKFFLALVVEKTKAFEDALSHKQNKRSKSNTDPIISPTDLVP